MTDDIKGLRERLRALYRKIDAEGGASVDEYGRGFNDAIGVVLAHLSEAGFEEGQSTAADNLEAEHAESVSRGKHLRRLRNGLIDIRDGIEDEGDRVYFGSTNDADDFREIVQGLDDFSWDQIMREGDEPDLLANCRAANARADAAEAKVKEQAAEIERQQEADATLHFIAPALPVLRTMLDKAGLNLGVAKADEMLAAINAYLASEQHDWFVPDSIGYECCRKCGIVRRADDKNGPCRGRVAVTVRDTRAEHAERHAAALAEALDAMLRHSCVADSAPEDKFAEDHDAERRARAAVAAYRSTSESNPAGPPRAKSRYDCPTCDGGGEIVPDVDCPDCDGTGWCVRSVSASEKAPAEQHEGAQK